MVSYSENMRTGKAKVTVKGIGAFGGTKTLTFRITEKKRLFKHFRGEDYLEYRDGAYHYREDAVKEKTRD